MNELAHNNSPEPANTELANTTSMLLQFLTGDTVVDMNDSAQRNDASNCHTSDAAPTLASAEQKYEEENDAASSSCHTSDAAPTVASAEEAYEAAAEEETEANKTEPAANTPTANI